MQRALIFSLLFAFCSPVEAQNEKLTLHIQNVLFRDFVDHLEKEMFCKIYYADDWVDPKVRMIVEQEAGELAITYSDMTVEETVYLVNALVGKVASIVGQDVNSTLDDLKEIEGEI